MDANCQTKSIVLLLVHLQPVFTCIWLRPPEVKKLLGLPDVPTPAETASQPEFSLLSAPNRDTAVKTESSSPKTTKFTERSVPPSVVSQRRQGKQVRGRKKSKN
ncbi:hypothetical protein QQP08_001671 [Theobroma cacao]|nr:hypothetical protein QQP08_001671 [Theobroma cacao]